MSITYRQARLDDAPAAHRIWAEAVNDLNERHGFGGEPLRLAPPHPYFAFAVASEPQGFWVAEEGDRVIGFALSWVRGSFWFLAFLFVMPGYQGKGVGRHLLEQAIEYGNRDRVTSRALITFAYNPTSISLYIRYGMYPRVPLYTMIGRTESVRPFHDQARRTDYERVTGEKFLRDLCRIDDQVLSFPRETHHRYLLTIPGAS
jgi:ribosomal protein S18 acetylase RimI-like enzyme